MTVFMSEVSPERWPTTGDTGAFAITLLCLTYCTAAAGLVNGTNHATTRMCIEFIRRRFKNAQAPSGLRYEQRAAVLYTVFRHGLVHQWVPGMIDLEDGRTLGWGLFRDNKDRANHLLLLPSGMYHTKSGQPDGHHRIFVQPDLLFEDCLRVFQEVQAQAAADQSFAQTIFDGATMAAAKREVLEGKSKSTLDELRKAVAAVDGSTTPLWL